MAATRQLKQQVTELIMNDDSILKVIAEAVSTLIVEKLSNEDTIEKVASNISRKPDFVNKVSENFAAQKDAIKQELYESLQFDHHELKKKFNDLEKVCNDLRNTKKDLEWEIDSLEQYGRRNCLLLHGVPESCDSRREFTDTKVIDIINDKLDLDLDKSDLDRSHRLGRKINPANQATSTRSAKPLPIIVKFISHNIKSTVFRQKRKLKGSGFGFSETLTKRRMEIYSTVSQHPNIESAWTLDGRVIALRSDTQRKVFIDSPSDFYKLSN